MLVILKRLSYTLLSFFTSKKSSILRRYLASDLCVNWLNLEIYVG